MTQGKIRRDLLVAFTSQFGFKILGFAVLPRMALEPEQQLETAIALRDD
jgi:hypothetical protein